MKELYENVGKNIAKESDKIEAIPYVEKDKIEIYFPYQKRSSMLHKIRVSEVGQYVGKEITLHGWLYNKRSSGKLHFLQLKF